MFKAYEEIKDSILSGVSGVDKREGSFVNDMVSPISLEIESAYQALLSMLGIMFLEDATGEYLEKRASEFGLTRKLGTKSNGEITFNGIEGAEIIKGTLVGTSTGLLFETDADVSIEFGQTSVSVGITASEIGTKYNVAAETITEIPIAMTGISSCINNSELADGTDVETDDALLARTLLKIQTPSTSGNSSHYKEWSLEVDGIGDAKVTPLWNGPGTVKVLIVTSDKKAPSGTLVDAVVSNIEDKRPIGASVSVVAPTEININVDASIAIGPTYSQSDILSKYTLKFKEYIKSGVFKLQTVDYYKCLSIFYEIEGVIEVTSFLLNNVNSNIPIGDDEIQVVGTITLT